MHATHGLHPENLPRAADPQPCAARMTRRNGTRPVDAPRRHEHDRYRANLPSNADATAIATPADPTSTPKSRSRFVGVPSNNPRSAETS